MLGIRELATIRGALLFWKEEMCPNGYKIMRPYLEPAGLEPLSEAETERLRMQLHPAQLRYTLFHKGERRLASNILYLTPEAAELLCGPEMVPVPLFVPEIGL